MVTGAFLGLLGMGLLARSLLVFLYIPLLGLIAQLYHLRTEEPQLVERFGEAYLDYRQRVPRCYRPWVVAARTRDAPELP